MRDSMYVDAKGGTFKATASSDPNNPGIVVEFIVSDEGIENLSRPTIMMEKTGNEVLRALVWSDKTKEDYTQAIVFE